MDNTSNKDQDGDSSQRDTPKPAVCERPFLRTERPLPPKPFQPTTLSTFRRILFPGAFAMILIFAVAIGFALKSSAEHDREHAITGVRAMSQILSDNLNALLSRIDLTLLSISDKLSVQTIAGFGSDPNIGRYLDQQASHLPEVLGLRISDATGQRIYSTGNMDKDSISDRDYFRAFSHSMAHSMFISEPVFGHASNSWVIVFSRPILGSDGAFKGVVQVAMEARTFAKLYPSLDLGPHGVVALWHRGTNLSLVSRYPEASVTGRPVPSGWPSAPFRKTIESGATETGFSATSALDGIRRTLYLRQIGTSPLYIVVGLAEQDIMAPWWREATIMSGTMVIFILLSLGSTILLNREWTARLNVSNALYTALDETENARAIVARSHEDLRMLIDQAPHAICMLDATLSFVAVSRRWTSEFQQGQLDMANLPNPKNREQWHLLLQSALNGKTFHNDEDLWVFADESEHWVRWVVCPWSDGQGHVGGIIISAEDITERRKADERLRQAAVVFNSTQDGIVITDQTGTLIAVNPAVTTITGFSESELLGNNLRIVKSGRHDVQFYQDIFKCVSIDGYWQGEIWNRRKNGDIYPEWLTISPVLDDDGTLVNYVGTFSDISRIKQSEAMLEHLAHHDPLTGLPNRLLLLSRLEHAIGRSRRFSALGAVFFIDLDRFKNVNDSLGHPAGDELLQLVSTRFSARLRSNDTLARLGGDEFVILLEDLTAPEHAGVVAQTLLDAITAPFKLSTGHYLYINASIGISIFPNDGDQPDEIIRNADTAMYQSKTNGRGTFRFYTQALTKAADARVVMETNLRRGLERQEFVLHYQPLVSLCDGRMKGFEALVRWQNDGMLVPPLDFISVAEEAGIIGALGTWVMETACAQMAEWIRMGLDVDVIAVNVSPLQFRCADFIATVETILKDTGLAGRHLELELTEGLLMEASDDAQAKLWTLKRMGVRIAIDDFGTGYSSLAYLKRFPLDKLKVDQSFIRDIPVDNTNAEIASAIIAMAKSLHLEVVAEGIETDEQFNFLNGLGCHTGQGFLFSQAVPADIATRLLRMLHHDESDGECADTDAALVFPQLWG